MGCGTAGPAAALFLSRAGHRVTLYERVVTPGPAGAGIVLQPTGQLVLARLGLFDAVVSRGARLDRLYCETASRRPVVDLAYADVDPRLYGVGLHRGTLFEALWAALAQSTVRVRCGIDVTRVGRSRGGHTVVESSGRVHGPHELVVIATGARTQLEGDAMRGKRVERYPWGALWYVAADPEARFTGRLYQVVDGTRRMLGLLPTGRGPGGGTVPLVSLFWSVRGDRIGEVTADLAGWKRTVAAYAPPAEALLAQIVDPAQLLFAAYHDVTMPDPAAHEGVVYLGDAGHAMSPQLGQGCNLALFDAMELADALGSWPDLTAALAAYNARRREHLDFYQFATRWLTPFFQSDYGALGVLRDRVLGAMGRVPYARRQMVASMGGFKTGVLRGSLDLAALAAELDAAGRAIAAEPRPAPSRA